MRTVAAPTQAELGLNSMVDILSGIAQGTNTSNSILNLFSKDFFNFSENSNISLIDINKVLTKKFDTLKSILNYETKNNFLLEDIATNIRGFNKNQKLDVNVDNNGNDSVLTKISSTIDNIYKHLTGKKPDNSIKDDEKPIKTDNNSGGIFDSIAKFAESIVIIKKNLTSALTKNVSKFLKSFDDSLSTGSKEKMKIFGESMEQFGTILVDLDKKIKSPTKSIGILALSFLGLSLAIISPTFILSIAILGGFVALMNKMGQTNGTNDNVKNFGIGILSLTASLILMQFVPWEAMFKMITFVAGLGLALKFFSGPKGMSGDVKTNPMMMFGIGIGILTISMLMMQFVPWEATFKMIMFVAGLGLALKFFSGPRGLGGSSLKNSPMLAFATGIGILTLALFAMAEIPWGSIFKMIFFIGGLGLTMKLFNFNKMGPMNSMFSFAFGIGLFILAILAFEELPWGAMFKTLLFIGGLGLTMKLFNFNKMGPANGMISFAFGFGIMVLAMYAINELPWEAMFKTIVFLGGLGLVMKLFNGTSGLSFLLLSIGIIAISGALYIFKKIGWTITDALVFGGTLAILAGVVALAGIPVISAAIGLGTLAIIGMSVGLLVAGLSLWAISNLTINYDNLKTFAITVGFMSVTFAAITPFALIGAVGAVAFLPIAVTSLISAITLKIIETLNIDETKLAKFAMGIDSMVDVYFSNSLKIIPATVAALAFFPIAAVSMFTAITLRVISALDIDNKKIASFGVSVKTLVNGINDLGGWDLAKTALKAVALLPIFGSALVGGLVLRLISGLDINPMKIATFGITMSSFTSMIADVLVSNEEKLKKAGPGINALAKLMNISGSLARTIQLMANLQFYEYGVENGKLVLKGVRTLNAADFKRVGENLGTMLQTLIEPLTILGSNSNSFVIGGKVITNPFKSSTALKGIDMLAKVGNAFKPLAESIKTYASLPMVSNPALLNQFRDSLIVTTTTFLWIFGKLATTPIPLITMAIGNIVKFQDAFKNTNTQKINELNTIFEKFVNNLSDDVKWKKINLNLVTIKKHFQDISKSINNIDIQKATLFERNIRNLIDKNNAESLRQAVESLAELLNLIKDNQETIISGGGTVNTSTPGTNTTSPFASFTNDNKSNTKPVDKTKPVNNQNNQDFAAIVSVLSDIASRIGITNSKLDNLKVRVVGGNSNSL